jgi:hypothetical protein
MTLLQFFKFGSRAAFWPVPPLKQSTYKGSVRDTLLMAPYTRKNAAPKSGFFAGFLVLLIQLVYGLERNSLNALAIGLSL